MQIEGDQCRRCGSLQTEVIDRRYRKKVDRVIRRRKCLECGYKWNTVEVYADEWERLSLTVKVVVSKIYIFCSCRSSDIVLYLT